MRWCLPLSRSYGVENVKEGKGCLRGGSVRVGVGRVEGGLRKLWAGRASLL